MISSKARKILIMIIRRSSKPDYLTAGNMALSLKNFASVMYLLLEFHITQVWLLLIQLALVQDRQNVLVHGHCAPDNAEGQPSLAR